MLLIDLVETANGVARMSGRLAKVDALGGLLRRVPADAIDIAVGCLTGAPRQGRLGVGFSLVREARDTPAAAEPTLTLQDVDHALDEIRTRAGPGATGDRRQLLRDVMSRATESEQDFLARLLLGALRQGALEGVMLEAVARAASLPAARVRRAAMLAGDLALVARAALVDGETGLDRFRLQAMQPVQPMLADSADDVETAVKTLGEAALEWKIDGARIQVHKVDADVRVFSRNLLEVTPAVPEVVEIVRAMPARSLVLDGEVIALRDDGSPHPFQVTMRRFGRRLDVEGLRAALPLTPYFFDCLLLDDRELVDEPQASRFVAVGELAGADRLVPHVIRPTLDEARAFYDAAIRRGHEGVMAKSPASPYTAGSRGSAWVKVKAAHTLDLVVLAAEWGSGRRRGWLSNLHLGARDTERGGFVMLGKTFKGLTDQMLEWQTGEFLAREIGRDQYTVYLRPELVVEIAFNDLQRSPRYPGGLALRLARVKRYRTDKLASEADTFHAVQGLYERATGEPPPPRGPLATRVD
jgi:DNA ligase-1